MPNCHIDGYVVYTNKSAVGAVYGDPGRLRREPTWIPSPEVGMIGGAP